MHTHVTTHAHMHTHRGYNILMVRELHTSSAISRPSYGQVN